jgi:beta-lactam-binding protein with PASTA domain
MATLTIYYIKTKTTTTFTLSSVSAGGAETVPDVAGMSVTNAKSTLLSAGFSAVSEPQPSQGQFFVNHPTIPKGRVVGTDPAAGSAADKAGAILLIISSGP